MFAPTISARPDAGTTSAANARGLGGRSGTAGALLAATIAFLALAASPAFAASGMLHAYGRRATSDGPPTWTGWRVSRLVTDTLTDGICVTVWLLGRNWVLAYGTWEPAAKARGRHETRYDDNRAGLYRDPSRIGTADGWQRALDEAGLRLRGHRLVRADSASNET